MHYSVLLALPLFVGTALAQTPVFPNAAPRATPLLIAGSDVGAPSLRYWGASATNGTSLLNFGGRSVNTNGSAGPTYYNGLDGFNPTTNTWTNLSPDGATGAPSNRHGHRKNKLRLGPPEPRHSTIPHRRHPVNRPVAQPATR
ncbi:MAG: hypothetical protein ACJAQZ_003327, partial [Planctomycetota bacterium]